MDLGKLVSTFNALSRPEITEFGFYNCWIFVVHHIPLHPEGDILHLVTYDRRFNFRVGPAHILYLGTVDEQATVLIPLLLDAFINHVGRNPRAPQVPPFAPWKWETDDKKLAKALEEQMASLGVREELCKITTEQTMLMKTEKIEWIEFLTCMLTWMKPKCSACRSKRVDGLIRCNRCQETRYCSEDCYLETWMDHQAMCDRYVGGKLANEDRSDNSEPGLKPTPAMNYYVIIAPHMRKARILADEIGLKLPGPDCMPQNLLAPIWRLVITGNDTPLGMSLLLGSSKENIVEKIHRLTRLLILLQPPEGSAIHTQIALTKLDENCPDWTPREATEAEEMEVKKIRDIQGAIARHMGARKIGGISNSDTRAILGECFGPEFVEKLEDYELALKSMDRRASGDSWNVAENNWELPLLDSGEVAGENWQLSLLDGRF